MTIRNYLIVSYLALILLMTLGMWGMADRLSKRLTAQSLANAERGAQRTIDATYRIAEKVLTTYGQWLVESKVEGVARGLAFRLKDRDLADYGKLRQDEVLRRMATQEIQTPEGVAGHLMVYDRKGEIVFIRTRLAEGRNVLDWQKEYPQTHEMIERSLTQDHVHGYFTYFDRNKNKERQRFAARVHIPGTAFILSGSVLVDEFFEPAQEKIKQACEQVMTESKKRIRESSKNINRQVKLVTLVGGTIFCLLGVLSAFLFASAISQPISHLRDGVRQVGEGNFEVAVPEKGAKEVKQLAQSFNQLGEQLTDYMEKRDFIRDTFSRYVTQEVVKKLLESKDALKMGGETREVSILMSDLRGFTAMTATMEPEAVIDLLNRFLSKMIAILLDHRAIIDEIVGDGILAFFGAPEPMEDHPAQAVACALRMQVAMHEINALNDADGLPLLEMGVAVNTGEVVVGNIGSERRAKYSVVGKHVNLTSRIESYALGGQVFISDATYQRLRNLVDVGDIVQADMKGVPGPVTLFEVLGMRGPYDIHLTGKIETLIPLTSPIPIHLYRFEDKIATGTAGNSWITHLCETAATVSYDGELGEWEDISIRFLDANQAELPGKIYGKVTRVKPGGANLHEAAIRFTSVSPEMSRMIDQFIGAA